MWVLAAVLFAAVLAPSVATAAEPPWRAADRISSSLFDAQTALLLDERAERSVESARRALSGALDRGLERSAPGALRDARLRLGAAQRALALGDQVGLAAARGAVVAALRRGAYAVALDAVRERDVAKARAWLLIRDFREATRFTRPGVDATVALGGLTRGRLGPRVAETQVKKDLLDAYQARLVSYLNDAAQASERGFGPALAESAALARGYWLILEPEYRAQRGSTAARSARAEFTALERAARGAGGVAFEDARERVLAVLDGFTAAPFTAAEQARRASQLTRFLDLVPIEYDDGTEDGRVTIPFELQEAVAFIDAAQASFDDLEPELQERDPGAVDAAERAFASLRTYAVDANERRRIVPVEQVDAAHARASSALDRVMPDEWKESTDEADFDLIEISLDQMEAAVSASEYQQAEQARLTAYAFFEFGPEIKLRAFDPQLVSEVEGLVWYGARGANGLAELISGRAGVRELRESRLVLDEALDEAKAKTGDGASGATVITNAALIVFREGLEAILIIAAITASMVGGNRALRRPVFRGALLALPASVLLFAAAVLLLDSFSQYGEKLEAVVSVVAIAVLMLVLNWFFHRVYWTQWIAGHRKRGKQLLATAAATTGVTSATVTGLYLLGFSSVFREGFETVLFLQALQLSSGTPVVLAGVSLGLVATGAVGAITFALERRLPYKRMLIITGVLISLVLVVLVGNTVRTLQGVGWLSITPLDFELPLWVGTWLGIFPTVETLGAQALAMVFVLGSYFAAERLRHRGRRRRPVSAAANGNGAAVGEPVDDPQGSLGPRPMSKEERFAFRAQHHSQDERDQNGVIELAGDRDEVGHEIDR